MYPAYKKNILVASIGLFFFHGCETVPIQPDRIDPRGYRWSVKEISYPGASVSAEDIWGSSPQDVYVVFSNSLNRIYKLFHFNGTVWTDVNVGQFGSSQVNFDLYSIWGFAPDNVWAAGARQYYKPDSLRTFQDSTLIIHFDGITWSEVPCPRRRTVLSIGANSPTSIWFGGVEATLLYFNGSTVEEDNSESVVADKEGHNLIFNAVAGHSSGVSLAALNDFSTGYFHFLQRSGNSWTDLDHRFAAQTSIWISPSGKILSTFYSYGLYTWNGQDPWSLVRSVPFDEVFGSSDDNIFLVGADARISHFNGIDWHDYKDLEKPGIFLKSIWTDGREVFIIGTDFLTKSYIYHGK